VLLARAPVLAQSSWQVVTTDHFEIYYERQWADLVDRLSVEAERVYGHVSGDFRINLPTKVPLIVVGSADELPRAVETIPALVSQGMVPNRDHLLLPLEPVDQREGILTHELTHHFEFEAMPGFQRTRVWILEGLSEYERGRWIPSGPVNGRPVGDVPTVDQLTNADHDWGRIVFEFIGDEFGADGIRRYMTALRENASSRSAIQQAFGLDSEEFDRAFLRYVNTR
jgi:hypothetical protein